MADESLSIVINGGLPEVVLLLVALVLVVVAAVAVFDGGLDDDDAAAAAEVAGADGEVGPPPLPLLTFSLPLPEELNFALLLLVAEPAEGPEGGCRRAANRARLV